MDSRCPPHWTFAARAAYFGDRMCAFCDHRNPAGAQFCNQCASPLHLKPCKQCDAVNEQAATHCYKCAAACPAPFGTPQATLVSSAGDSAPGPAITGGVGAAAQPLSAASALRAGSRMLYSGQFVVAAIATVLIAGAYGAYRLNLPTPAAVEAASQPRGAPENNRTTATPAVPVAVESMAAEAEQTAALQTPIPATDGEAANDAIAPQYVTPVPTTQPASAHERRVPVAATKHARAHGGAVAKRQARVGGAASRVPHTPAAARAGARVAQSSKAARPEPWKLMQVSLARCGGDLIAHIVCDQRVRFQFCKGRWGQTPQCPSGVADERGQ